MKTSAAFGGLLVAVALSACGSEAAGPSLAELEQRAYVVSRDSDELAVIDLKTLDVIGRVRTGARSAHMAELSLGFDKVYVTSPDTNEVIVVDARTLKVKGKIAVGHHPTHISLSRDGSLLAVMAEEENAVSFIDPVNDVERARLPGFATPHFMRFAADGKYGYVANAGASRVTRVDLTTLKIDGQITLEGVDEGEVADEGGFHDAQIDADGVLYAAHGATGRVIVYDTVKREKLRELTVGANPWMVFAEHPFASVPHRYLVPNFGDQTVSRIDGKLGTVAAEALPGDEEAYGVNYSSAAPDKAFVMNRVRKDIAVVDTATGAITARIPVGGNTETASTTADGKWVVAAVSGADRVVVIDTVTNQIVKTFDGMAAYPWSVTIPFGQNYCH